MQTNSETIYFLKDKPHWNRRELFPPLPPNTTDAKPHSRPPSTPSVEAVKLVTAHSVTPFICQKSHSLGKMCHINQAEAIFPSRLPRFTASSQKRLEEPHIAQDSCNFMSGKGKSYY